MADKTCQYCTLDTGGNHEPGCPSAPPITVRAGVVRPDINVRFNWGVDEYRAENARLRKALERIVELIGSPDYIRLPEAIAEARRALRGEE